MAGTFTVADADIGKGKVFGALINKAEIRAGGEASDQYQSVGAIAEGSISFTPALQNRSGGMPTQFGWKVEISLKILATGTNMRAALVKIIDNWAEARLTDVNGHKYTFTGTTASAAGEIDLTVEDTVSGDYENSRFFLVKGAGYITKARYTALYAES